LKIKDFAGLNSEICYFRRYDVAYNGKLRQIRDAQDRVVLNCRYDKKTGEIIRSRDMMDNETYYSYDKNRNLILVSRSEENIDKRPLMAIKYDQKNNPVEYELLDKDGKPVTATKLKYGQNLELASIETPEAYNKFNYNAFGYLTKFTDTFGRVFARNYNKFNRLVSQVSPEGVFVVYS
jgi:YD repeat-containing protein